MNYQITFENGQQKGCLLLAQWDRDAQLTITGLPQTFTDIEIHWGNRLMEEFYVVEPTIRDDSVIVLIPNILLQAPENIIGYIYLDSTATCYRIDIEIQTRQKPQGVPTDPTVPFYPLGTGIFDVDSEKAINAKAVLSVLKGGDSGQSLHKKSNRDLDFEWRSFEGVSSVNGQTGDVTLGAEDVGALPNDTFIPTKTSDLQNDSRFITNAVNDLLNYYLKTETYNKTEVNNLIGAIQTAHFEVVQTLPQTGESNVIYLVPRTSPETGNYYDEYIYTNNNWEKIGSTDIDLTGYATESWVNTQIANFLTQSQIETLVANALSQYYPKTAIDELLENKANKSGAYPELVAGNSNNLISTITRKNNVPYNFRTSGGSLDIGNQETDSIVGGTVVWNQLVDVDNYSSTIDGHTLTFNHQHLYLSAGYNIHQNRILPVVSGHTFYIPKDHIVAFIQKKLSGQLAGTVSLALAHGTTTFGTGYGLNLVLGTSHIIKVPDNIDGIKMFFYQGYSVTETYEGYIQLFDLTSMFGSTIADYIYSLETSDPGAGLIYFRQLFPRDYYPYDAGTLLSVKTSAHRMVGFNAYNPQTGEAKLVGNCKYQITGTFTTLLFEGSVVTPDTNGYFTPTYSGILTISGGNTTDTCVHLVWDSERDGQFEPYHSVSYSLSDIELYGMPLLDTDNSLYYNGDIYSSDGKVTRKYKKVAASSLSWTMRDSGVFTLQGGHTLSDAPEIAFKVICSKYVTMPISTVQDLVAADKCITSSLGYYNTHDLVIKDTSYTDLSTFISSLSNVDIVYELATPTVETENVEPFTNPQWVDDWGTEEYVDTREIPIPVGHDTQYTINLKAKLEMSPDSPDSDGFYLVRRQGGLNKYVLLGNILDNYHDNTKQNKWRKVVDITLTQDSTRSLIISQDLDGNTFELSQARIYLYIPKDATLSQSNQNGYFNFAYDRDENNTYLYNRFGAIDIQSQTADNYFVIEFKPLDASIPAYISLSKISPTAPGTDSPFRAPTNIQMYFDRYGTSFGNKIIAFVISLNANVLRAGTTIVIEGIDK